MQPASQNQSYHNVLEELFKKFCLEQEFKLQSVSSIGPFNSNSLMTFPYQNVETLDDYHRICHKFTVEHLPIVLNKSNGQFRINSVKSCFSILKNGVLIITIDLDFQCKNLQQLVSHTKHLKSEL